MIRACIIGISGYGRVHYDLLTAAQAAGEVEIVGAAIINQDEEQERCAQLRSIGCRLFDDYTVMLSELAGEVNRVLVKNLLRGLCIAGVNERAASYRSIVAQYQRN